MFSYEKVKDNPIVFLAFTGLELAEFEQLLVFFSLANRIYIKKNHIKGKKRQRRYGGGRRAKLATLEDQLFFILFYFKTYPLQAVIAFFFGLSQGQANEWIYRLSEILKIALDLAGQLPERDPQKLVETLANYDVLEFVIDGTERRRDHVCGAAAGGTFHSHRLGGGEASPAPPLPSHPYSTRSHPHPSTGSAGWTRVRRERSRPAQVATPAHPQESPWGDPLLRC